ncbi:MAG TPA: DUF1987 domain-containing protein [Bacteroidales bacterium]|jgi:Domain of unknown function (DUF1987).
MENLLIKGTSRTPEVDFNIDGHIRIKGRSIPEDAGLFYNHLYSWIFRYCLNPLPETVVNLELEYMNSGSAKSILQILRELSGITHNGEYKLCINWYYELGDEDMFEKGEYFQAILRHNFVFIETD